MIHLEMQNVQALRLGMGPVLSVPAWVWRAGETWAVVGPNGAGKTTFGELLAGRLRVTGQVRNSLTTGTQTLSDVVTLVGFQESSRLFSTTDHYYQERFQFSDPLQEIRVEEYLRQGLTTAESHFAQVVSRLHLEPLLSKSFITLSNGQTRRVRIARGVLRQPAVLVLDDPHLGLDPGARLELDCWLAELVHSGQKLLLLTRPEFVPHFVTHILELAVATSRPHIPTIASEVPTKTWSEVIQREAAVVLAMTQIRVAYGETVVLQGLDWTVRQGDRWALWGGNGSGKSTLLSLICGDHPQAYANRIELFGRRRGSGESIWEIKRRIGFLSPELHLFFHEPLTAWQTAATGFLDHMTYSPPTTEQRVALEAMFAEFRLTALRDRPFRTLSTGQQRLVLFVRALVKRPDLLILDEPFQALDRECIDHAKAWLDTHLNPQQTLILVSHHLEELPSTLTHILRLTSQTP
ncbi:MAG: ATP-binding cassette domain-containing protein [Fimbriiglobus sp.]